MSGPKYTREWVCRSPECLRSIRLGDPLPRFSRIGKWESGSIKIGYDSHRAYFRDHQCYRCGTQIRTIHTIAEPVDEALEELRALRAEVAELRRFKKAVLAAVESVQEGRG